MEKMSNVIWQHVKKSVNFSFKLSHSVLFTSSHKAKPLLISVRVVLLNCIPKTVMVFLHREFMSTRQRRGARDEKTFILKKIRRVFIA